MRTTFGVYRAAATAASSARRRYPSVAAPTGPTIRTTLGAALAANTEAGMIDPAMASASRVTTTMTEPRFIERSTPHRPANATPQSGYSGPYKSSVICAFVVYRSAVHRVTADSPNVRLAVRGPGTRLYTAELAGVQLDDGGATGQLRQAKVSCAR